ncbi:MAG TPA: GAF domain-containing sensor histidine kinase [Gaiellaceae bacterium]
MTAEAASPPTRAEPPAARSSGTRRHVGRFLREFRARLRDRRFWIVQALVIGISAAHTALEATQHLGVLPDLALLPVSTYFIPVVYAALNFGVEGAVPTALWSALLTVPNLILWHTGAERPGVVLQLTLLVAIAYMIARRVDAEKAAKERAEAANARLERLNRTAAASARSLELENVLSQTVEAMLDGSKDDTAWIMLTPDQAGGPWLASSSDGTVDLELPARALETTRTAMTRWAGAGGAGETIVQEEHMAVAPLRVAGEIAGAVGLAGSGEPLSPDELKLLQAVANQLSVSLGNIRYFHQTQLMVGELSRSQAALEEYVRLATDAQEEERKRLARELHDDTIQSLVIAKAELDALATDSPVSVGVGARLKKVETTLAETIDNVRRFSRDLRPSLLDDLGLVHAIDWLVGDLGKRTGVNAQLRTSGDARRLSQKDELALFRIVQEALHNVERHADANNVRVRIHFGEDVRATVVDNGNGFDSSELSNGQHAGSKLGLLGVRERAKLAGATLSIRSRPSSGTRVVVTLKSTD